MFVLHILEKKEISNSDMMPELIITWKSLEKYIISAKTSKVDSYYIISYPKGSIIMIIAILINIASFETDTCKQSANLYIVLGGSLFTL